MSASASGFYTGSYRHYLDEKARLTIPSDWRSAHAEGDTFLATPLPEGYIAVLPPEEVAKLHAKVAQIALSDASGQDFVARFFAATQSFRFDKQGRVGLSSDLLEHAGIKRDAVLVGAMSKFNIYAPERWEKVRTRTAGDNYGDIMRRLGI
ncbi:MAG TPA: mraZ [Opitutaceae bacterium]|jgi:MraZ protein|nr:mraZ [Opitutaceae bacterium]